MYLQNLSVHCSEQGPPSKAIFKVQVEVVAVLMNFLINVNLTFFLCVERKIHFQLVARWIGIMNEYSCILWNGAAILNPGKMKE